MAVNNHRRPYGRHFIADDCQVESRRILGGLHHAVGVTYSRTGSVASGSAFFIEVTEALEAAPFRNSRRSFLGAFFILKAIGQHFHIAVRRICFEAIRHRILSVPVGMAFAPANVLLSRSLAEARGSRIERRIHKSRVSAALHPHQTFNRHK